MERKIRIGAVSYLNTKPLIHGLESPDFQNKIDLILDYPANLVNLLNSGKIDIGLIPVGALPALGHYSIVSRFCIGTLREVASVALFSQVKIEHIQKVILDYQSRTSVLLCKILFERYWKRKVEFSIATGDDFIDKIEGNTAGLIIGDRALSNLSRFNYVYDLGIGWKDLTGLPFVFAVWAAKEDIDERFLVSFDEANALGADNISSMLNELHIHDPMLINYFHNNISYNLDADKKRAMDLFLNYIHDLKI